MAMGLVPGLVALGPKVSSTSRRGWPWGWSPASSPSGPRSAGARRSNRSGEQRESSDRSGEQRESSDRSGEQRESSDRSGEQRELSDRSGEQR
eukprot:1039556-Prorocentrum_minimum.AAC.1